ncbi:TonB-dependent receptor plug domain-containing protein [Oceanicaulis sp. LC35]|uniref:TonB-dependent receptor plug domain-containing protein n=1 Tax=Oceanicaulis sp. LC35 TaxID=3349635 RepID=UPI003F8777C5
MRIKSQLLSASCLIALYALTAPVANAQNASEASEAAAAPAEDVITVTGSRIQRASNAESAVPLQILSADDLQETGTTDLAEALIELPGVSASVSPKNSNNLIQTSGLSTISLRRLGDDRTLVLINGMRAVSNSGNSDRVSLGTIPLGFVERTEVTTGGASAIYGSDAIAGVANFKLEDDFEGVEVDLRYTTPEASGGDEYRANALWGTRFDNDRGYALFGVEYRDLAMIRADDTRPESIAAISFDDPSTSSNDAFADQLNAPGCTPDFPERHCFLGSRSSYTPGGVFESGDAWFVDGQWFNDKSLQPSDRSGSSDFFSDVDGYNYRPGRTLLSSRELLNIGLTTSYEFTPSIEGSFTALYSDIESVTAGGYQTLGSSNTFGVLDAFTVGDMASNHPFIPDAVQETRSGSVSFTRRLVELGEQARINERTTLRLMANLNGELNDRFDWTAFATYGHFTQDQENPNEVNFYNAQRALDIESDGNGGYQCVDAAARADGCVPLNLFGEGSISEAAANYIRYDGFATQSRTQYTAGGYITGELFDIWAGPVKTAAGVEYRREEQDVTGDPDGDVVGGLDGDPTTEDRYRTSLSTFPTMSASYEVIEGYAEIDVPLIADQLNFQAAARVADYDTVGAIFSYNAGMVWRPIDDFGLRAQYSRSQRAPNITELFSPPRPDSDDLIDPCEGLMADGTGLSQPSGSGGANADLDIVRANCLASPGIQAYFANPENIDPSTNAPYEFDPGSSVYGPNAGNPNVQEETADTFTIGAIFQPRWVDNLTLIVDYYSIQIEDAITSIESQDVVDLCYSSADFPNNKFCDVITRNPNTGEVVEVINYQENLDRETVEGIDMSLDYRFELPQIPGRFDIDFRYSHYITQEVEFEGIGGTVLTSTSLGEINTPENEARLRLGYREGPFRMSYTVTYAEGGIDDLLNNANPGDDRYFKADDEYFHRIYASYTFGEDDQYRVYGGVNNLFDNLGPLLPTGLDNGSDRNISESLNDPTGREFYLGVTAQF